MAKTRRIHEIAKELGVDSKAIVAKCLAEGVVGIKDHMSPVKLGLELTIKEWFSAAPNTHTAVETAEHVDIEKAKKTARRRKAKPMGGAADGSDHDEGGTETAVQTLEKSDAPSDESTITPAGSDSAAAANQATGSTSSTVSDTTVTGITPPTDQPTTTTSSTTSTTATPTNIAGTATPSATSAAVTSTSSTVTGKPSTPASPSSTATPITGATATVTGPAHKATHRPAPPTSTGPTTGGAGGAGTGTQGSGRSTGQAPKYQPPRAPITPAGQQNVPTRPTVVTPAGPRLTQPTKVQLKGPQVVRIEKPDEIRTPRRSGPGGSRGPGGGGNRGGDQGGDNLPGILKSRGPVRGRGAGGGTVEEDADKKPAANKRRSLTSRRGRSATADLPIGPTKFTEADLAELDAKLNRATGYVKQRRRDLKKAEGGHMVAQSAAVTGGKVLVEEPVTIKNLSSATGIKSSDILKYLFQKGIMANINSAIANDMAMEVALEYDIDLQVTEKRTLEQVLVTELESQQAVDVKRRPPIVTVMGHVDHGKTSLLDAIRSTDVAAHEAGGITQHIGAYRVTIKASDGKEKTVVFLDTPGHEAFTTLRARGAAVTDIVVLVVAADDGVMPQTLESINHAKAAGVPIIVALNKIDKPEATEANIRKIFGQLAEHGLNPTEWGGTTEVIKVSATNRSGVSDIVEMLDYQAELLDLKADHGGASRGTVVEAMMAPGRGPVARVLVQQGTMKIGDFIVVGRAFGRVRDMTDDRGKVVQVAGPATPVELSGIDMLCDAGDKFYITDSLQRAEEIAVQFREKERLKQLANQTKVTLETFAAAMDAGGRDKELRVVLKADVQGSSDVLKKSLESLGNAEVSVKVLHAAVGGITESDVLLADASDAVIIGFNVVAPAVIRDLAEQRHVEVRNYRIIYDITEDVKKSLEGMLSPETKEEILGTAEVREVFKVSKVGTVAGCLVTDGNMQRNAKVRIARQDIVIGDNRDIDSLKRFKEDAKEVRAGMECGIKVVGFDDLKTGDKIICYQTVTVKRKLGG